MAPAQTSQSNTMQASTNPENAQILSQCTHNNFVHIMSDSENMTPDDTAMLANLGVVLPLTSLVLRDYLPHRYPFMLLDRVIACRPNQDIIGIKNVTINEPFFTGHFPDAPIMPGVLMIEAMAQVAGVLGFISDHKKPADGYLYLFAGVEKVRFKRQVIPGDQLILRAKNLMVKQGISKFDCTAYVDNQLVATAQIILSCQFTPPDIIQP